MEVILLERVERLGQIGDVVNVKNGFARNYLLPRNKALRATKENREFFEGQRKEIEAQNAARRKEAEGLLKKVEGQVITLIRQAAEDGRLFGSVTARDIAAGLAEKAKGVDYHQVQLNQPIKYTGIHEIKIVLHPEVTTAVRVNVARTEGEAEEALAGKKKGKAEEAEARQAKKTEDVLEEILDQADRAEAETAPANDSEAA